MDEFFSGQIFRQATRIPDARGGRAWGYLILEPGGRRGAPPKYDKKHENPRKWEALGAPYT